MPHAVRGGVQPLSKWILSDTYCRGFLRRISALLFVLPPGRFQSMELE